MSGRAILSRPVAVVDLPSTAVEITASEVERRALATAFDLVAVNALSASVELAPAAAGGIVVEGHVVADIVQTCVVSLVPLDAHIDESFSIRFVRDRSQIPAPGAEVVLDPDAPDPPELIDGPTIDVGALVEEHFVLAIDPYPRAPGAQLPAELAGEPDQAADSPFAALAKLGLGPGKGQGGRG